MKKVLAALAVAAAVVALSASPASAHASLESSDPAANADLPAGDPPAAITLDFTEGVHVSDDAIDVLDGSGGKVDGVGKPEHGDSSSVIVASLPDLDDGTYIVNWHVVSQDSHPISGAFSFNVGEPTADAGAVSGLLDDDTSRGVGISFALARALAFAGVLILVGGLVFLRIGWPDAVKDRNVRSAIWLAWLVALVTAPVGIGLQAAYTNRSEIASAWDTEAIGDVLGTHFGQGWAVRVGLCLLAIPFVRSMGKARSGFVTGVEIALGVALLGTITISGHARTGRMTTLATTADLFHLGGGAVWLGGLVVLAVLMWRAVLPRGSVEAATRFSALAAPAMTVIIITGVVQSWRQLDGPASLLDTTYGRLLLAKLGLVALILAAASAGRAIVKSRISPDLVPTGPGAARMEADPQDARDLRNAVVVEVVFAALVLLVTAVLVNTAPARAEVAAEDAASSPAPASAYEKVLRGTSLDFVVTVSPAIGGLNDVEVVTRLPSGDVFEPLELNGTFAEESAGIQPLAVEFTTVGPGSYVGSVQLVPGEWTLELKALVSDFEEEAVTGTVPIR